MCPEWILNHPMHGLMYISDYSTGGHCPDEFGRRWKKNLAAGATRRRPWISAAGTLWRALSNCTGQRCRWTCESPPWCSHQVYPPHKIQTPTSRPSHQSRARAMTWPTNSSATCALPLALGSWWCAPGRPERPAAPGSWWQAHWSPSEAREHCPPRHRPPRSDKPGWTACMPPACRTAALPTTPSPRARRSVVAGWSRTDAPPAHACGIGISDPAYFPTSPGNPVAPSCFLAPSLTTQPPSPASTSVTLDDTTCRPPPPSHPLILPPLLCSISLQGQFLYWTPRCSKIADFGKKGPSRSLSSPTRSPTLVTHPAQSHWKIGSWLTTSYPPAVWPCWSSLECWGFAHWKNALTMSPDSSEWPSRRSPGTLPTTPPVWPALLKIATRT